MFAFKNLAKNVGMKKLFFSFRQIFFGQLVLLACIIKFENVFNFFFNFLNFSVVSWNF